MGRDLFLEQADAKGNSLTRITGTLTKVLKNFRLSCVRRHFSQTLGRAEREAALSDLRCGHLLSQRFSHSSKAVGILDVILSPDSCEQTMFVP